MDCTDSRGRIARQGVARDGFAVILPLPQPGFLLMTPSCTLALLLATLVGLSPLHTAQARDLYRVSATLQDDYFLDQDSVMRSEKNRDWRGGAVLRVLDEHNTEGAAYTTVYMAADCGNQQRVAILGVSTYDKEGTPVRQESIEGLDELEWMLAPDDTHFAMVWAAMCTGEGLSPSRHVGNQEPKNLLEPLYASRARITKERAEQAKQLNDTP